GSSKAIRISCFMDGARIELVRWKIDPALKDFGGATGATLTRRPVFSARLMRASSGESVSTPYLVRNATLPMPGTATPAPEIAPVGRSSLANGMSACWTAPATDFSTTALQRGV